MFAKIKSMFSTAAKEACSLVSVVAGFAILGAFAFLGLLLENLFEVLLLLFVANLFGFELTLFVALGLVILFKQFFCKEEETA